MINRFAIYTFAALIFVGLTILDSAAQTAGQSDIRKVDFMNFTYYPACTHPEGNGKGDPIRVKKGEYTKGSVDKPDEDRIYFNVTGPVVYGDLNGDGIEEAALYSVCNTGGTGQFTEGYIFSMQNGKPTLVTTIDGGDRAEGGITGVKIQNGLLKVERFGTNNGGACCPEFIETSTYKLVGKKLSDVGKPTRRKYDPDAEDPSVHRVKFEPGRTKAVIKATSSDSQDYLLRAKAGQTMIVHITSTGKNATVQVFDKDRNSVSGDAGNDWTGQLPVTGDYRITVTPTSGTATFTLEITIR